MHKMTNTDLTRILKSEEIQKALRAPKYVPLCIFCTLNCCGYDDFTLQVRVSEP